MARIFPFRAYRYSPQAGRPADLLTQPYDKISPEMQQRYYQLSPYNFARLTKPQEEASDDEANNIYTRAAQALQAWIADGILQQDPEPALYPYFQSFTHPDTGASFVRKGFIGLTEAVDYDAGIVHRHELTHSGPKLDRLQLTRHTRSHFGQLFVLYDDPASSVDALLDEAARQEPLLSVEDEYGVGHQVWRISDSAVLATIAAAMAPKKLLIADGHHRYETALAYHHENLDVPGADRVMMTFVNLRSPGLVVLATHRLLTGLQGFDPRSLWSKTAEAFDIEVLPSPAVLEERLREAPDDAPLLGAAFEGDSRAYLLSAKPAALEKRLANGETPLDVVVLHRILLGEMMGISEKDVRELRNIRYIRGFEAAIGEVQSGAAQVAFLLRPVAARQVAEIAFSGGVMPQKSTDFYPKLLSGLTIYRFG